MKQFDIPSDNLQELNKLKKKYHIPIKKQVYEALLQYIVSSKSIMKDLEFLNKQVQRDSLIKINEEDDEPDGILLPEPEPIIILK